MTAADIDEVRLRLEDERTALDRELRQLTQVTRDPAVIEAYLGKRWLARMRETPAC